MIVSCVLMSDEVETSGMVKAWLYSETVKRKQMVSSVDYEEGDGAKRSQ